MAELKEKGLSWGEAQASAKDRTLWQNIVVALCPTGDEEDKWGEGIGLILILFGIWVYSEMKPKYYSYSI